MRLTVVWSSNTFSPDTLHIKTSDGRKRKNVFRFTVDGKYLRNSVTYKLPPQLLFSDSAMRWTIEWYLRLMRRFGCVVCV